MLPSFLNTVALRANSHIIPTQIRPVLRLQLPRLHLQPHHTIRLNRLRNRTMRHKHHRAARLLSPHTRMIPPAHPLHRTIWPLQAHLEPTLHLRLRQLLHHDRLKVVSPPAPVHQMVSPKQGAEYVSPSSLDRVGSNRRRKHSRQVLQVNKVNSKTSSRASKVSRVSKSRIVVEARLTAICLTSSISSDACNVRKEAVHMTSSGCTGAGLLRHRVTHSRHPSSQYSPFRLHSGIANILPALVS